MKQKQQSDEKMPCLMFCLFWSIDGNGGLLALWYSDTMVTKCLHDHMQEFTSRSSELYQISYQLLLIDVFKFQNAINNYNIHNIII